MHSDSCSKPKSSTTYIFIACIHPEGLRFFLNLTNSLRKSNFLCEILPNIELCKKTFSGYCMYINICCIVKYLSTLCVVSCGKGDTIIHGRVTSEFILIKLR